MVKRIENTGLDEFTGKVSKIDLEEKEINGEMREQYHIHIEPKDVEVKGETGHMHEWVQLSPKTQQTEVPQGSVVDRYLQQIEICISEAKTAETLNTAFDLMVGKTFKFKKIKLGRDYDGNKAREVITPVALVE